MMRDVELELRRSLERRAEPVGHNRPLTSRLLWRVRVARLALPAIVLVICTTAVAGASLIQPGIPRTVAPAPAEGKNDGRQRKEPPRESYPIPDAPRLLHPSKQGLWVGGFRLTHIDFRAGSSVSTDSLDAAVDSLTYGYGKVWAALEDEQGNSRLIGAVLRDNQIVVTDEVELERLGNIGTHDATVGQGAVWVTTAEGVVQRYDVATAELTTHDIGTYFDEYTRDNGPLMVIAGKRYVWFAATPGEVIAFDPETAEPAGPQRNLGWNVVDMAFDGRRILVLHTTPSGRHQLWRLPEENPSAGPRAIPLDRYGPSGTLVAQGRDAYVARGEKRTVVVYGIDLRSGKVLEQSHAGKDAYAAFTVRGDYGWLGDMEERSVERISLPHLLTD